MVYVAALRVDDDFPAGQSAIPLRAADHEPASGIDVIAGLPIPKRFRDDRIKDLFEDLSSNFFDAYFGAVLGRDDDGVDSDRLESFIEHGYLRFSIRADPLD